MRHRLACHDVASPLGEAVEELFAEVLGLLRPAVRVVNGELREMAIRPSAEACRHKTIRVDGMSPEDVTTALDVVLSSPAHEPGQEAR